MAEDTSSSNVNSPYSNHHSEKTVNIESMQGTTESNSIRIPLHRRIAEKLSDRVTRGILKPGAKLPSERQIAQEFSASRATVRTALQHLEQEGLISRRDRRSAIVSIRRDVNPFLRLACSDPRQIRLFRQLAQMQILPSRSQLQLIDMQQPEAIRSLMTQPASSADMLFCDLKYVNGIQAQPGVFRTLPSPYLVREELNEIIYERFKEKNQYIALPLAISPVVLYYNRAFLRDAHIEIPQDSWTWEQLAQLAEALTDEHHYGFQFRPSFSHLSTLFLSQNTELYRSDGSVAVDDAGRWEKTIHFMYDLLHIRKVTPLLVNVDQINLFTQRRCALAMDGFEMYFAYKENLGDNLGVARLPGREYRQGVMSGFAAVILAGQEKLQAVDDLAQLLLKNNTQRIFTQLSAGLPIRSDLLNLKTLVELGISEPAAGIFLRELGSCRINHLPATAQQSHALENLFLELWLGLDHPNSLCQRFKNL